MRRLICLLSVLLTGCLQISCSLPANPRTEIGYGPWRFHNSKDVSVKIAKAGYDPNTHAATLEGLELVDNASAVREANIGQIKAYTEQVIAGFNFGANLAQQVASVVPWATMRPGMPQPNYQSPPLIMTYPPGWQTTTQPQPQTLPPTTQPAVTLDSVNQQQCQLQKLVEDIADKLATLMAEKAAGQ